MNVILKMLPQQKYTTPGESKNELNTIHKCRTQVGPCNDY